MRFGKAPSRAFASIEWMEREFLAIPLSEKNVPLVTLSNSVTWPFHEKLKAWAKVAIFLSKIGYVFEITIGRR